MNSHRSKSRPDISLSFWPEKSVCPPLSSFSAPLLPSSARPSPKNFDCSRSGYRPCVIGQSTPIYSSNNLFSRLSDCPTSRLCYYSSKRGFSRGFPKAYNQDAYIADVSDLYGVLDGHGPFGHEVSEFLKTEIPQAFASNLVLASASPIDIATSLQRAIAQSSQALLKSDINTSFSGSTLSVACVTRTAVVTANIGDSRCIIGRRVGKSWKAVGLTRDHKPSVLAEKKRIVKAGGRVGQLRSHTGEPAGPMRVWKKDSVGLAMSRSLGDKVAHTVGVSSLPDISVHSIGVNDQFLVVASDGVWEFMSNDEVVKCVGGFIEKGRAGMACEALVKEAVLKWKRNDAGIDDITAVLVLLKQ